MRNRVYYEWTLEEVHTDGDIIDSNFIEKLSDLSRSDLEGKDLGLVHNQGNEANGLEDRCWAYVKDGKLPEFFSDAMGSFVGVKVPQKFHIELEKFSMGM